MTEQPPQIYRPPPRVREGALIEDVAEYDALYRQSIEDPDKFWGDRARELISQTNPLDPGNGGR